MASVEKRGKTWSIRYCVKDEYGNIVGQKRKSGYLTKTEAMNAVMALENASGRGIEIHSDEMTCGDILHLWQDSHLPEVAETSRLTYRTHITILMKSPIATVKIKALKHDSLRIVAEDIARTRKVKIRTGMKYTMVLVYALNWAYKRAMIVSVPFFDAVSGNAAPKPKRVSVTEEDIADMVQTCKEKMPHFLPSLYLALYGGLRRGEVAGLQWSNVDFQRGLLRIESVRTGSSGRRQVIKEPKTESSMRTVTIPAFVLQAIESVPRVSDYVSLNRQGKPCCVSYYPETMVRLIRAVNASRREAGRPEMPRVTFHDLRHVHAALCINLGAQPKVLQERLGHRSIKTTMDTYAYLMPGAQSAISDAINDAWAGGQVSGQVGQTRNLENVEK